MNASPSVAHPEHGAATAVSDLPLTQRWRQAAEPQSISPEAFARHEQAALATVRELAQALLQASKDLGSAADVLNRKGFGVQANGIKRAELHYRQHAEEYLR